MTHRRKLILGTFAALMLTALPASANETFNYSCNISGHLQVDTTKNVLFWRGKKYAITVQPKCAKYGWHAVGNGTAFDVCVATQGVASVDQPGHGDSVCDQFPSERGAESVGWMKSSDVGCNTVNDELVCNAFDHYTDVYQRGGSCATYGVPFFDRPNGKPIGLLWGEAPIKLGEKSEDGRYTHVYVPPEHRKKRYGHHALQS
jgi:hypothetical protein